MALAVHVLISVQVSACSKQQNYSALQTWKPEGQVQAIGRAPLPPPHLGSIPSDSLVITTRAQRGLHHLSLQVASVCVCVSFVLMKTTVTGCGPLESGVTLSSTELHLQGPYLQTRSHSKLSGGHNSGRGTEHHSILCSSGSQPS